jgi:uncharacterized protein YjbI with pentapeptide repeats
LFIGNNLKRTKFVSCQLQGADFTESDLKEAVFNESDLTTTTFQSTNLEKADLSNAYNYNINPVYNKIKKAKFSRSGLDGLLSSFGIVIVD